MEEAVPAPWLLKIYNVDYLPRYENEYKAVKPMMRAGFILLLCFWCFSASAQRRVNAEMDSVYVDSIQNFEIQLEGLSNNIINGTDKVERITSCFYFVQTLKEALKVPNSFDYDFS